MDSPFAKAYKTDTGGDQSPFVDEYTKQVGVTPIQEESSVLPVKAEVTQKYGTDNPELEVFSGGKALDTNFAVPQNTPVSTPPGQWYVVNAYNEASPEGYVGDPSNQGYGNAVMLQNAQTGEKLHFIHLANTNVKPGQMIGANQIVGQTGSSGNATGPNLGVEYYNQAGQLGEVLDSPYGQYFQKQ